MSDQHSDPQRPPQDGAVPPPPAPWGAQQPGPQPPANQPPAAPPQPGGYPGYQQPSFPAPPAPAGQGYGQQGYGQQGYGGPQPPREPSALGGLTDLGLSRRITPGLARLVYIAVLVLAVLVAIGSVISAFGAFGMAGNALFGGGQWILYGLVLLVTGPLAAFVVLAFARFWLEYFLDRAEEGRRRG